MHKVFPPAAGKTTAMPNTAARAAITLSVAGRRSRFGTFPPFCEQASSILPPATRCGQTKGGPHVSKGARHWISNG